MKMFSFLRVWAKPTSLALNSELAIELSAIGFITTFQGLFPSKTIFLNILSSELALVDYSRYFRAVLNSIEVSNRVRFVIVQIQLPILIEKKRLFSFVMKWEQKSETRSTLCIIRIC
jgi:hypothetical protein